MRMHSEWNCQQERMNDESQQKLNLIIRYDGFRIHWLFDDFYCPLYTMDCIDV